MGPDRGVSHKRRYPGSHDPPLFGGVALVLPDLPGSVRGSPKSRRQAKRNEIDKGKWACPALFLFFIPDPFLSPGHLTCGPLGQQKLPESPFPFRPLCCFHPVPSWAANRVARKVE